MNSLLTGESGEITKKPGDLLMSGSFVVSGECYARLDRVGEDSYISKLTLEAKAMNHEESVRNDSRFRQISRSCRYYNYTDWSIAFWTAVYICESII